MIRIELKQIVNERKLDTQTVAEILFAGNAYPMMAYQRVAAGKAELKASQMAALAALAGCEVSDLYSIKGWSCVPDSTRNILSFKRENYLVRLDTKTLRTQVFDKDKCLYEDVVSAAGTTLSSYLQNVTEVINQLKTKKPKKV